jgi:hypothetical protein
LAQIIINMPEGIGGGKVLTSDFRLEPTMSAVSPPRFRGTADAVPVTVELDNSAIYKLAGKARGEAIPSAIEGAHSRIQAAAARLFDMGAFNDGAVHDDGDGAKHIRISALDID